MRATFLVALVVSVVACRADRNEPGIVVSPDMAFSIPYDPFDPNPVTANGATLILPPEGTVPVGAEPFFFEAGAKEVARAGLELNNPIEGNAANLKRGKHVFETFCAVCHGREGKGDGTIVPRFPKPPSLHGDRAKTLPDGAVFHIITKGQGIMASYAAQVRPADRWRAIHYLRQLQGAK